MQGKLLQTKVYCKFTNLHMQQLERKSPPVGMALVQLDSMIWKHHFLQKFIVYSTAILLFSLKRLS